jgi:type IV secretory pathway VirB9-like protein
MIEQESEWILKRGFRRAKLVENPDDKSKKARITSVPGKCKETHKDHWKGRIVK